MRTLDSKFLIDKERIIKASNGEEVPLDEPLFLIRARDRLALQLLMEYRRLSIFDGCNDYHMTKLDETIKRFLDFSREHPERMKQPSVTRGL